MLLTPDQSKKSLEKSERNRSRHKVSRPIGREVSIAIRGATKINPQHIETKAASLDFTIERDSGCSHYQLKDPNGQIVLLGSLKKIDAFLDDHIRKKADALGFRLSTKKVVDSSFDELSSGEARAVQREATTGYKLDAKEFIHEKAEWITVLGPDHTATLSEVIERLNNHVADAGIDNSEVESGGKRKPAPTKKELDEALNDHPNAEKIKSIQPVLFPDSGRDRSVGKRSSHTKQEDDRIKSLNNLIAVVNNPKSYKAFLQLPKHEQQQHWKNLRLALEEDERISDAKHGVTKKELTFSEMERLEEQPKKRAHRQAELAFNRTSYSSIFDRYKDETDWEYRDRICANYKRARICRFPNQVNPIIRR